MVNTKAKVSVIVPAYNAEEYIEKCVKSVLDQSFREIEVIVVDDGSKDNTRKILESIKDERLVYCYQNNSGVSTARNRGIDEASGELILFLDADDYFDENMVETLVEEQEESDADLLTFGYKIDYVDENYKVEKPMNSSELYKGMKNVGKSLIYSEENGFFDAVWNKMYKKEIIRSNSVYYNESYENLEDYLFNCEYIVNCKSSKFVKNFSPYNHIATEKESLSCKYKPNLINDLRQFTKKRIEVLESMGLSKEEYERHVNFMHITYMINAIPNIFRVNSGLSEKEKKALFKEIVNDERIKNHLSDIKCEDSYFRIFKKIYSLKNIGLMYCSYKSMFIFRNNFASIYIKMRKKYKK